ncbi:LysR family transcriptional regulator [Ancylobacter sp. 6x-1]|uniref:LysR family transcriptional regulator n=1 Tax=Ancylobacter crimeensis TaxID=2579147 RepID=A0ABT0DFB4_9HYPH|nr:LysR family transcriptional regulator [Ancylobacter crimeensis]MCK0198658.1 LysR family transcriptional regulator [Ancylobacter crimeensis]
MDQLAAMRAFAGVVETGSFTRAADRLDMPKATVTKLVQQLEARLGTRLLNRTTRRVGVTPDGAAYYERANTLLNDLDELDSSMASARATPRGRLRVDVSTALALLVIIPALASFHARFPDIALDLGVSDRPVDLIAESVDCVIRGGDLLDPTLVARRIAALDMVTCATPAYVAEHGPPAHPTDLESTHRGINYFSPRTGRSFPFTFERDGEAVEVRPRHMVSVNDSTAYVAAALAGLGIAQLPAFMARPHIADGSLVRVLTDWAVEGIDVHVVYPPNRHLSSRVRVFVDWIAELFATSRLLQPGPLVG